MPCCFFLFGLAFFLARNYLQCVDLQDAILTPASLGLFAATVCLTLSAGSPALPESSPRVCPHCGSDSISPPR
jgi:hypothetical protein